VAELHEEDEMKGFRNFLMQGNVIVVAVGLVVALAFSGLIKAFTTGIIDPIVNRAQGNHPIGLGVQLGQTGNASTFLNFGTLVTAIIYFIIFMAVVYLAIVVPYKRFQARRGVTVFGAPAATKACPYCLSTDLPLAATKCRYCGSELPGSASAAGPTTAS
jgi:large conductance mechanosensitive channel